jgi:AraC-like DNA-binding protein
MKNYFRYFPVSPRTRIWGCEIGAIGRTRIPAGAPYPLARHPDDHHFQWERGRILESLQIVFIPEGSGVLETGRPGATTRVLAGDVFLVFPNVWHRFAPDPASGWTEHWVECRGRAFDAALEAGVAGPSRPVIKFADPAELMRIFDRLHILSAGTRGGGHEAAATLALHLLSLVGEASTRHRGGGVSVAERLECARRLLMESCDRPFDARAVAAAVGLGGSHFRQAFRRVSGVGPRAFHAEARLRRAADLLANTELSAKEIAETLGFSSAFHFSNAFKRGRGVAPSVWRSRPQPA